MRKPIFLSLIFLMVLNLSSLQVKAEEDVRLLRFPDIHDDLIAFVYAGDIWTVDAEGGNARRLTSHKGLELFPRISPDGRWIAFSGQYSGSRQVYVMPAEGGTPRQLTWYNDAGMMPPRGGFDHVVLDWTPDGKHIIFRANRTPYGRRNGKYFKVSLKGGLEEPLAIPEGGFGVLSPDGNSMCYTPISREFRTWKRYKGGRAADLWIYDLKKNHSRQITDFEGTDQIPVWHGNKIYFASDRTQTLNIHSYDLESGSIEQITHHKNFDVMWPSGSDGKLVYEHGGYIHKLDLPSGQSEKITVNIRFDNPNILPYHEKVKEDIHSYNLSPKGNRAVFDARGDIFSVPKENGNIRNLTHTQGVREIYPGWSPDGRYLHWISDKSGEYEIYLKENKAGAEPRQLTQRSSAWKYQPVWSPDSKMLLYSDRTLNLKLIDVESGQEKVITRARYNEIRDYSFSPDSRWITYTKGGDNGQDAIWVYNIEREENHKLTGDTFNDLSPVFSQSGHYIWFLSNRDFNLSFSDFEFDYLYNEATRIYALALQKDSPRIFEYKSDEVQVAGEGEKVSEGPDSEKSGSEGKLISIDFEGIQDRVTVFPMSSGNYSNLQSTGAGFIYISEGSLHQYDVKQEKAEKVMDNVRRAVVAADGKHMLYRYNSDYGIAPLAAGQSAGTGKLDLGDMMMKIDPPTEWRQIYRDGWRIFRDFFYVSNLHGLDWKRIREKYAQLLPHLSHRADLDYIFGEMVAETNTGHCYVNYGDFERVDRIETGLLGARLSPDQDAGYHQITRIYPGENWNDSRRSPLTEQGVDVGEGDYLIRIDGQKVDASENPYRYLENKVDRVVEITVNDKPTEEGASSYKITPVESELSLMYLDWVQTRRKMVDELSGGRIGYIHVPNTSVDGNRELFRGMYAYHHKDALIIDDRYNGGGFIPDVMADLLDRETLSYWHRQGLEPSRTPAVAHDGPKAMLINHYSSSGGDAFPYYFRKKGLGKLIGTRTWGGLVGMSGNASLVDGGYIAVPRFGIFNEEEQWIIEGIGVYPDIRVVDTPHKVARGQDPSLEKAVEVLLEQLEEEAPEEVNPPRDPDRSGWIEEEIRKD